MKQLRVELKEYNGVERRRKTRRRVILAAVICIVVFLGSYWLFKDEAKPPVIKKEIVGDTLPRMANLPPREDVTVPPPPSYPSDAPLIEQARNALRAEVDPAKAVDLARSFPEHPERADAAFLLLEYAADSGNPEAALEVGKYYDPLYKGDCGSIRKNPVEAYEWYQEAIIGGKEEARSRLTGLRTWVEEQAAQGSGEARNLLKVWR